MASSSTNNPKNPVISLVAEAIATGLGSGKWPFVAPATVGTFAALVAYWLLDSVGFNGTGDSPWYFALIIVATVAGIWATEYIDSEEDHDPKRGVIDEWVGMWVTVLFLPVTWQWMLAGFVFFRALDILKPLGIRRLEAWPGGWGIMFDDIAAGVLGAVMLNVVRLIFFA